ncbi:hypothetical protein ACFQ5D_10860 [Paenibacillus farraposensis]|jgi:hypothetical protein|uniref:DUF2268 domain-containing protein n=1 Tax=Paenibacillus farraposensis TaxID=2807095 RepID=A0ABW4DB48_9BACL|nr:hypothetical protein [Paenibacillus farraposensis]MCC3380722.1 hypothetical protein [Paenibacillus farraposensis]
MKNYGIAAVMRRELEKVLSKDLTAEQTKILDQAENLFKQVYQTGFNEARLIGGEEWSNNACLGYAILGARKMRYSEEQTKKLIRSMYSQFDLTSVGEAIEVYNKSSY